MTEMLANHDLPVACPLTAQELRVLKAFVECGNVPAAAKALFLSKHTVDRHMDNMREKLGLHHNMQVGVFAAKVGWV